MRGYLKEPRYITRKHGQEMALGMLSPYHNPYLGHAVSANASKTSSENYVHQTVHYVTKPMVLMDGCRVVPLSKSLETHYLSWYQTPFVMQGLLQRRNFWNQLRIVRLKGESNVVTCCCPKRSATTQTQGTRSNTN